MSKSVVGHFSYVRFFWKKILLNISRYSFSKTSNISPGILFNNYKISLFSIKNLISVLWRLVLSNHYFIDHRFNTSEQYHSSWVCRSNQSLTVHLVTLHFLNYCDIWKNDYWIAISTPIKIYRIFVCVFTLNPPIRLNTPSF